MATKRKTPKKDDRPAYRRQRDKNRGTDRAFVVLAGFRHYLGDYNSKESREEYRRLILEWEASGRAPLVDGESITIVELCARYLEFAAKHYRSKDGSPTGEYSNYLTPIKALCEFYGRTPAREFGPKALKSIRSSWIGSGDEDDPGLSRTTINAHVARIKRIFKWSVEEEHAVALLLAYPFSVYQHVLYTEVLFLALTVYRLLGSSSRERGHRGLPRGSLPSPRCPCRAARTRATQTGPVEIRATVDDRSGNGATRRTGLLRRNSVVNRR